MVNSSRGIHFYRSPDFVTLTEAWIINYRKQLAEDKDPFTTVTVVVHSHAMARYLNQVLARELGVTALIEYILPQEWENQVRKIFSDIINKNIQTPFRHSENLYDPNYLRWAIYRILTHQNYQEKLKSFPILDNYLFHQDMESSSQKITSKISELKAYQLSEIMARLFNNYLYFREEMLWEWDNRIDYLDDLDESNHRNWQRWLWQTLRSHLSYPHRQEELAQIKEVLKNVSKITLPKSITIFGISYLPPYYLEMFQSVKHLIDIDYYFPDTTLAWGESVKKPIFIEKLSELSQAYLEQIERLNWKEIFLKPQPLSRKKGGILSFIKAFCSSSLDPANITDLNKDIETRLSKYEYDLQVHYCPNQRREVEVVKDQILFLLENNSEHRLTLDKILILAPDILIYQDYLKSVFTSEPVLPYHIIDRNENYTNTIVRSLLTILELMNNDWKISHIKDVLDLEVVQIGQNWGGEDLYQIYEWLYQIGVKRGRGGMMDIPHHDLEKYGWKEGILRTMLHLATPSENMTLHGDRAQNLGTMVYFLQRLLHLDKAFQKPLSFKEWLEKIQDIISILYLKNHEYRYPLKIQKDHAHFKQMIQKLSERSSWAFDSLNGIDGYLDKMTLQTFTEILKRNLSLTEHVREGSHRGIICGSLLPLRIIPASVTFIMGMAREEFPRHDQQTHFNLIQDDLRPGDQNQKKGDYLLFIETLFATRHHLGITFSPGINNATSPSILVEELLALIKIRSGLDSEEIIIQHPQLPLLTPNPSSEKDSYKRKTLMISNYKYYNPEDHRSAIARLKFKPTPVPSLLTTFALLKPINIMLELFKEESYHTHDSNFTNDNSSFLAYIDQIMESFCQKKNEIKTGGMTISWEMLKDFFSDAPRFYFNHILKINLHYQFKEDEEEPLILEGLGRYQVLNDIIRKQNGLNFFSNKNDSISLSSITDNPKYPPGIPGKNQVELLSQSLHRLRNNFFQVINLISNSPIDLKKYFSQKPLIIETTFPPTKASFPSSIFKKYPFKLEGVVGSYEYIGNTLHHIICRHPRINAYDVFRGWLDHLLLHTVNSRIFTWIIGEEVFYFPPLLKEEVTSDEKQSDSLASIENKLFPYIMVFAFGHSHALPIYKELSNIFHDQMIKKVKEISQTTFITETQTMASDYKKEYSFTFKENDLFPNFEYPYAHYLWGIAESSRIESNSEIVKEFSQLYHFLWGEIYQFLKRIKFT